MNRITIIGTVHFYSQVISPDTIYDILCALKPDIILNEIPIDCDDDIIGWAKSSLEYNPVNESLAILRYQESHKVVLRAYDIYGLGEHVMSRKFNQKEDEFDASFSKYFKSPDPNPLALQYKKLIDKFQYAYGRWNKLSLAEMNSRECDIASEAFLRVRMIAIPAILDLVPELTPYKSGWLRRDRYEIRRDKAMVTNILNYNRQYEDKDIVVLCGYFHRYAIIKGLIGRQEKDDFKLITDLDVR